MTREPGNDGRDDGFTLVEVIVAMGIFLVVMVAVLSQVLIGVRGSARANEVTEEKGVIEARLELMRNLPWHVAPSAEQRIDILDRYYPNLTPSTATVDCGTATAPTLPGTSWTGYVSGTRCPYEPAAGPFFRTVDAVDPVGSGSYVVVTDVQFLRSDLPASPAPYGPRAAAAPPLGYNSSTQGKDAPISAQVGVTVTVFDLRSVEPKPVSDYTQISEEITTPQRVRAVANASALEVSGVAADGTPVKVDTGFLDLGGFLSRLSSATAQLSAVGATWSTDAAQGLSVGAVTAPPAGATTPQAGAPAALPTGAGCDDAYVCWGSTSTSTVNVVANGGLPAVGSSSPSTGYPLTSDPPAPVQAAVGSSGTPLAFANTATADRARYRPLLDLRTDRPLLGAAASTVTLTGCGGSGSGALIGRGYVGTTATAVRTCSEVATSKVSLFPTSGRPAGILDITLGSARATCTATHGTTPTGSAGYTVTVDVWGTTPASRTFTVSSTAPPSPADLQWLATQLTQPITATTTLADYVDAWTLGVPETGTDHDGTFSASVPGAFILTTTPVRNLPGETPAPDPDSAVTARFGTVSCGAGDAR